MQIKRNIPGSAIKQVLYFRDTEIDKMCTEALKKSGFMPTDPGPIDIETFVESYFETSLDFATEVDKGVLGWTFFTSDGGIRLVGVSPSLANDTSEMGTRRCRATVAHEAGHCLMHPILFMEDNTKSLVENLDFHQNRILCRKDDFTGRYDGRWWEVQANKAIGALLLPRPLVCQSVTDFLAPAGSLGIETIPEERRVDAIQHVADTFEVNLTPARIKLEALFPPEQGELL